MATGTIRFWAAAKEAAGCAQEAYEAATLRQALSAARAGRGDRFAAVLARCAYVVDTAPVGVRDHGEIALTDGGVIDVLPPFAGG